MGRAERIRAEPEPKHDVPFREAARFWVKLGFINFGGPTGQIAIMHDHIVGRRRWISDHRFLHALNYCMLLPGPEAQQLAIYIGWLLHKVRGGLVAGIAFILPAFFLMLGLSYVYAVHGDVSVVAGIFSGLQAAVVGIVAAAIIRIGRTAVRNWALAIVAGTAFVAIFVLQLPFPLIVAGAAGAGFLGGRLSPRLFVPMGETAPGGALAIGDEGPGPAHTQVDAGRAVRVVLVGVAVWILPLVAVALAPGSPDILGEEAFFFSKAAVVTFGGAYAALAYVNQAAVQQYGWLLPGQMVTGLGLAESTPGPLILVVEFVGFLGAYRNPGGLDPVVAGVLGATVTTWATFAPCFLWIFLGAPYIERLRGNRSLAAALSGVTAAVVGVILNLAVVFAVHTLFDRVESVGVLGGAIPWPVPSSVDPFAVTIAAASFVALWRLRLGILWVVGASAAAGLVRVLLG
ncbi:MAG TPA: chromate efflux transporter [Actinomycetota bacterium]|nr:chromate efflux transporter [Actinomycetota bacterium]